MGAHGTAICRTISLLQLFMIEADYLLVNTDSLAAVLFDVSLCRPTWGLIMSAILLPLVQLRTLHHVSFLRYRLLAQKLFNYFFYHPYGRGWIVGNLL